jgi:hypothetical protein
MSARDRWAKFRGCSWCLNTRQIILDRSLGWIRCPFCKEGNDGS